MGPWTFSGNVGATIFIIRLKEAINLNENIEIFFGDQLLYGVDFDSCTHFCFSRQRENLFPFFM